MPSHYAQLQASQFGQGGQLTPQTVAQLAGTLAPQLQQQVFRGQLPSQRADGRNEQPFQNEQQFTGDNPFGGLFDTGLNAGGGVGSGLGLDANTGINLLSAILPGGSIIGPAINTARDYQQSQLSGPSNFGLLDILEAGIANSLFGDTFGSRTLSDKNAEANQVVRSIKRQKQASQDRGRQDKDEDRGGFKADRASRGAGGSTQPGGFR